MTTPLKVHGTDTSHWNTEPDFAAGKRAGIQFAWLKATEGDGTTDPTYVPRAAKAKAAEMPVGVYHFARAELGDARAEATRLIAAHDKIDATLRPALDLETMENLTLTQVRTWAATFIAEVKRQLGYTPVVYTPYDLYTADDGCVIWRPRYNSTNTPPVLPCGIWQFSNGDSGVPNQVTGFGHVDLNTFRAGTTLDDILVPTTKPEPEPNNPDVVTFNFVAGNLGRATAASVAQRAYTSVVTAATDGPGRVDAVLLLEVGEGDTYDDKGLYADALTAEKWDSHFLAETRNPLAVSSRHGDVVTVRSKVLGKPVARWSPPRPINDALFPNRHILAGSLHFPAGAWSGDRPDDARQELRESWKACWDGLSARMAWAHDQELTSIWHVDGNPGSHSFNVQDLHPAAQLLYAHRPDFGIVVPAPGWRVGHTDRRTYLNPIEPVLHPIYRVEVDLKRASA